MPETLTDLRIVTPVSSVFHRATDPTLKRSVCGLAPSWEWACFPLVDAYNPSWYRPCKLCYPVTGRM